MSGKIDNRAVEMQFDNKQFESGVQQSLGTLDRLKKGLNLEGSAKGLTDLSDASKRFSLAGLASSVDTIAGRFTNLGIVGVTALQNISNAAINCGVQMLKSLTLTPITGGFSEYELKMGAIQTIMAGSGASLEDVNGYLQELNTYSDKTIYSFADMTQNIGKFTNAGVSLHDAVKAIQGVANEAAVSGANAEEAARAMYNFGQALSSGAVKLIDWKSIELANMGTKEFKEQLIEAAYAMGTLTKSADGTYATLEKGMLVTATKGFNESLTEQWLTSEVLTKVLGDYADETTEIGKKAFAAAQDVKTASQMFSTMREAVGSGWAQTFELLFGNFDEAKVLFTSINNVLGGFIQRTSDARNELLKGWKDLGGRTKLIETFTNVFGALGKILGSIKEAFRDIFPPMTAQTLYNITDSLEKFTEKLIISDTTAYKIRQTFRVLFGVLALGRDIFVDIAGGIAKLLEALFTGESLIPAFKGMFQGIIDDIRSFFSNLGTELADTRNLVIQETIANIKGVLANMGESIKKTFDDISGSVSGFFTSLGTGAQELADINLSGIRQIFERISGALTNMGRSAENAFAAFLNGYRQADDMVSGSGFLNDIETLGQKLEGFEDRVKTVGAGIRDNVSKAVTVFLNGYNQADDMVSDSGFLNAIETMGQRLEGLGDHVRSAGDKLREVARPFGTLITTTVESATKLVEAFGKLFDALGRSFDENGTNTLFDLLNGTLMTLITVNLTRLTKIFKNIADLAPEMIKGIVGVLDGVKGCLQAYQKDIKAGALLKVAEAIALLAAAIFVLSLIDPAKLGVAIGALTGIFTELSGSLIVLTKFTGPASIGQFAAIAIGMVGMALAAVILAGALKLLSSLSWGDMAKGLTGMLICMGLLVAVTKILGGKPTGVGGAVGEAKADADMMKTAVSLILFASAVKILASAVSKMAEALEKIGQMDLATFGKGLLGVGVILGGLYAFMKFADFDKLSWERAAGIFILALALNLIGIAIGKLGEMDVKAMFQGLGVLGAVLLALAGFNKLMGSGAGLERTAGGLLGLATAITIIAVALKIIATMSVKDLVKSMVALAGILIGLSKAASTMTKALPGAAAMIAIAAALVITAVALKIIGSMSWGEIIKGLVGLAGVLVLMAGAAILLAPFSEALIAVGLGLLAIGGAVFLAGAGLWLFVAALTALIAIGAVGLATLSASILAMAALIPAIAIEVAKGIIAFCATITEGAPTIIKMLVTLIGGILDGLVQLMPKIQAFLVSVLDMILEIIDRYIDPIGDLIIKLVSKAIDILFSPETIQKFVLGGLGLLNGILQGIKDNLDDPNGIVQTVGSIITTFIEKFGEQVVNICDALMKTLIDIVNGLAEAIRSNTGPFVDAVRNLIDAIIGVFKSLGEMFYEIGADIVKGLAKGMMDIFNQLIDAVKNLGSDFISGWEMILGIDSPSKVFRQSAHDTFDGFILGMKDMQPALANASADAGKTVVDETNKGLAQLQTDVNMSVNVRPTIRPVVDMTDVQNGIDSVFAQNPLLNVTPTADSAKAVAGSEYRRFAALQQAQIDQVTQQPMPNPTTIEITNYNTVRDDTDIQKISSNLEAILQRYNLSKGVLVI